MASEDPVTMNSPELCQQSDKIRPEKQFFRVKFKFSELEINYLLACQRLCDKLGLLLESQKGKHSPPQSLPEFENSQFRN